MKAKALVLIAAAAVLSCATGEAPASRPVQPSCDECVVTIKRVKKSLPASRGRQPLTRVVQVVYCECCASELTFLDQDGVLVADCKCCGAAGVPCDAVE